MTQQIMMYRHIVLSAILSSLLNVQCFKLGHLLMEQNNNGLTDSGADRKSVMFKESLPETLTVSAGQKLVLECEAGGRPVPTIHWLFMDSRVPQGKTFNLNDDEAHYEHSPQNMAKSRLQLGNTRGRLVIDCVTPQHAGEYACVAQTPSDRIMSRTFVNVEGKTNVCADPIDKGTAAAQIYMMETQRLEFEGADVQLFCRASGFPQPEMTWYDRNGDVITKDNSQYRLLKNGDLLVKDVNWMEHMGVFRCKASNRYGEDERQTFLYPTQP